MMEMNEEEKIDAHTKVSMDAYDKGIEMGKMVSWDYSTDLLQSKMGEVYHRKMLEYFKEEIKLIEEQIKNEK